MKILYFVLLISFFFGCAPEKIKDQRTISPAFGEKKTVILIDPDLGYYYTVRLNSSQKSSIAKQIFENETGGKLRKLVHWNVGETFKTHT